MENFNDVSVVSRCGGNLFYAGDLWLIGERLAF